MMKTVTLTKLIALFTACLSLGIGSCADTEPGLWVIGNKKAESTGDEGAHCPMPNPDTSGTFVASGVLDILFPGAEYMLYPLVQNNLLRASEVLSFEPQEGRIESNDVSIREAKVTFEGFQAFQPAPIVIPLSGGVVDAGGGLGVLGLKVIPTTIVKEFSQPSRIPLRTREEPYPEDNGVVKVIIRGILKDGSPIDSNVFSYPIKICRGCLLLFPTAADNTNIPGPDCQGGERLDSYHYPCVLGMDDMIDCRICRSKVLETQADQCEPIPTGNVGGY